MKKLLIAVLACLCLFGCNVAYESIESMEHTMYTVAGHYYTSGEVITEDGNIWGYTDSTVCNNESVNVLFDDMGTPDNIYDDEIVGLVSR